MNNNRGAIQSTLIVIISIVTLLALAITITYFVKNQINERAEQKQLTQEMAEFGMTKALQKISENSGWNEGFANVKYNEGFYTVTISKKGENTFKAVSTGFIRNIKTTITCTYLLESINDSIKPKPLSWEYN